MLRRRLVGALLVVATAVGGNTLSPRHARAQEVIDLDEDEGAKPKKKAGGKKKGAVDIDLDDAPRRVVTPLRPVR